MKCVFWGSAQSQYAETATLEVFKIINLLYHEAILIRMTPLKYERKSIAHIPYS